MEREEKRRGFKGMEDKQEVKLLGSKVNYLYYLKKSATPFTTDSNRRTDRHKQLKSSFASKTNI